MDIDIGRAAGPFIECGVALRQFSGQDESGDGYLVESHPDGVLIAVVDGLGHGPQAAEVTKVAVAALEGHADKSVDFLFKRCHRELAGTRGVVMSLASFSLCNGTMTWAGVGNVTGLLLRADSQAERTRETLLPRGGVVGYRLPSLYPVVIFVALGDVLIFATDGLRSGFTEDVPLNDAPQQIAEHILEHYGRGTDDALVLVARYVGDGGD
ncbi:MAG: SpoIIE family protein phosphatase [Anaerolineae bacterium]|jgi:negative regulator of sigma-B (phosphoserine phosphatase)